MTVAGPVKQTIPAEIEHAHPRGALAWARAGDAANPERRSKRSRFCVTLDNTRFLDGGYTASGYVIEGMSVADRIARDDEIICVDIREDPVSHLPLLLRPLGLYHAKGELDASGTVVGSFGHGPAAQVNGVAAKAVGASFYGRSLTQQKVQALDAQGGSEEPLTRLLANPATR
jgi:hypothetical protein